MRKEDIEKMVQAILEKKGFEVSKHIIRKPGDKIITYLCYSPQNEKKEFSVQAAIGIEKYFNENMEASEVEKIVEEIVKESQNYPLSNEEKWADEKILAGIRYGILNREKNKEFLVDVPHIEFGKDMAIFFISEININPGRTGTIIITENIFKKLNLSFYKAEEIAKKNLKEVFFGDIMDMLLGKEPKKISEIESKEYRLIVATTNDDYGASDFLMNEDLMEKVHMQIGNYYIVPSSRDEVIICQENDFKYLESEDIKKQLNKQIREVNQTIEPEMILSDYGMKYTEEGLSFC